MSFADRVLKFYKQLNYSGGLPAGIRIMNPYKENEDIRDLSVKFYKKYYNDENQRVIILGINPGRFGAGATGIPFTDTIRLNEKCGISFTGFRTFEPSSSFIYDMIGAYGGVEIFFKKFFISAICPLGFTNDNPKGKAINYNYYDKPELTSLVYPFIVSTLNQQLQLGIRKDICICLGTGKNDNFLRKLNDDHHFFRKIITLEHPRYIMQYKAKHKESYIEKYISALNMTKPPSSIHN